MAYPTNYDTNANLFADLINQKSLTLKTTITAVATTVDFGENLSGLGVPFYVRFTDNGEVVKVTASTSTTVTVVRAIGGTAAAHNAGVGAYVVLAAEHFNTLRDAILTLQKYRALRPVAISSFSGTLLTNSQKGKLAIDDTGVLKIKINTSALSFSGGADHSGYTDLTADTHTQYVNQTRFVNRHATYSGSHVTNGDAHDHLIGEGIGRIESGTVNPSTHYVGRIFYNTTDKKLVISNGTDWIEISGAPTGTIIMLSGADANGACPNGWQRHTNLDGKFPKGALASQLPSGTPGGVETHRHTYTGVPAHSHSIVSINLITNQPGSHTHSIPASYNCCGSGLAIDNNRVNNMGGSTNSGGSHSHSFTIPATVTGNPIKTGVTPVTTGNTGYASNLPLYQEVIFCEKL